MRRRSARFYWQGYPDLEYIIIDGGSTDQSVEIIRKYEPWLTYWVSEKDRGQSHAINKGFERASGEIGGYINSDDFYLPVALSAVAVSFTRLRWDLFIGCSDFRYAPRYRWLRRSWWLQRMRSLPLPFLIGSNRYGVSQGLHCGTSNGLVPKALTRAYIFASMLTGIVG